MVELTGAQLSKLADLAKRARATPYADWRAMRGIQFDLVKILNESKELNQ